MLIGSGEKRRKVLLSFVVLLCCTPLFFLNIKDSHDWGGDFAMYIKQAINISNGVPHHQTGYIYNENYSLLGPPAYTAGFPLLLSPLARFCGKEIKPYVVFMSVLLSLFALGIAFLLAKYNRTAAFMLPPLIILNPWTLSFKSEIVADIPFSLFTIISVLYLRRHLHTNMVIPGALLTTAAISIKGMGMLLFVSVIIYHLILNLKHRRSHRSLLFYFICTASLVFLFNKILFPIPGHKVYPYLNPEMLEEAWRSFAFNSKYYIEVIQAFFNPHNPDFRFLGNVVSPALLAILLFGMVHKFLNAPQLEDLVFVAFLIVILFYPYGASGFRYLLPLSPMLLIYLYSGLTLPFKRNEKLKSYCLIVTAVIVLSCYQYQIRQIINYRNYPIAGPYEEQSSDVFEYISKNTLADERILFAKPRVLSLLTNRACAANNPALGEKEIERVLSEKKINYILINYKISDEAIKNFVNNNQLQLQETILNDEYSIYKIIDAAKS